MPAAVVIRYISQLFEENKVLGKKERKERKKDSDLQPIFLQNICHF